MPSHKAWPENGSTTRGDSIWGTSPPAALSTAFWILSLTASFISSSIVQRLQKLEIGRHDHGNIIRWYIPIALREVSLSGKEAPTVASIGENALPIQNSVFHANAFEVRRVETADAVGRR